MIGGGGIVLHAGSRLWLGAISDPAKRSPRGGIASPTQCLSRERQGWVERQRETQHTSSVHSNRRWVCASLDPTYDFQRSDLISSVRRLIFEAAPPRTHRS